MTKSESKAKQVRFCLIKMNYISLIEKNKLFCTWYEYVNDNEEYDTEKDISAHQDEDKFGIWLE